MHAYYPKKSNAQYGFVQTDADNMTLFTKQQIEGALKVHHLYKTLGYPWNADFEAVIRVGGIGSCLITVDDAKVAYKVWRAPIPCLKGITVRKAGHLH
jgi:hypothetical protein